MNLSNIILTKIESEHRGKENAIKRKDLLVYCNRSGYCRSPYLEGSLTDRELRNIYSQLPVISSEAGIFWPIRSEELAEFKEYCRKKALPLFERYKMVEKNHWDLTPSDSEQMEFNW